jgi:thioredoxin-related protein
MFIDVYTDWCGWCKKMDASTFQDINLAKYLNSNFYAVKLNAETSDSLSFMGKTYFNTQQKKVKFLLDSLKKDLLSKEIEINKKDSVLSKKINKLSPKIKILDEITVQTELALKDTSDQKVLKTKLNSTFTLLEKSLRKSFKSNHISKNEFEEYSKEVKAIKKITGSKNAYSALKYFQIKFNQLESSLEKLNNEKLYSSEKSDFLRQKSQYSNFARRGRKSTHDVAIELCQGQLSYPTFILLFGDSLKANMPLKGFQKVPDLYGYLAFIAEGVYNTSRDVPAFINDFKELFSPDYKEPEELIKWEEFESALSEAKKDKKKILVHIIHPNSVTSNLMDKTNFRVESTAKKINNNFHAVKFMINESKTINYQGTEFTNKNGIHQLALGLSKNQLSFPHYAFLDSDGNLVMNVPQYFSKKQIDPVLDYFVDEGYLKGTYSDWLKTRKNN